MARMEPGEQYRNDPREGFHQSALQKFVVVGNTNNKFGKRMVKKFGSDKRIVFAGPIYTSGAYPYASAQLSLYFTVIPLGVPTPR